MGAFNGTRIRITAKKAIIIGEAETAKLKIGIVLKCFENIGK